MAENERQVIIDFELNATQAAKNAVKLQADLEELRKTQKGLNTSSEEGKVEYQRLGAEIKALGAQARKQQAIATKSIQIDKQQEGSLEQLRAQLSIATAAYDALGEAERNSAKGTELKDKINEITAALKPAEEATGRHQRNVGNYAEAIKEAAASGVPFIGSLKNQLSVLSPLSSYFKSIGADLKGVKEEYMKNAAAASTMSTAQRAAAVTTNLTSAALKVLRVALISTGLGAIVVVLGSLVAYFTKTQKGIEAMSQGLAAVGAIVNVFIDRIAKLGGALIKLFSGDFKGAFEDAKGALSGVGDEMKRETKLAMELKDAQNQLEKQEVMLSMKRAASRAEIAKLKLVADDTTKSMKERFDAINKAETAEMNLAKEQEQIAERRLAHLLGQKDVTEDVRQTLAALAEGAIEADKAISMLGLSESTVKDLKEMSDVYAQAQNLQEQSLTRQRETQNKRIQIMRESAQRLIAIESEIEDARIKAEAGYQSEDFAMKQQYALRLYKLQEDSERKLLDLSRKTGEIDASEYQKRLDIIQNKFKEFSNTQAREMTAYYAQMRESILSVFDKSVDEKIAEVTAKFEKARENLEKLDQQKAPERRDFGSDEEFAEGLVKYEEFLFKRAEIEYRMEKQKQDELSKIQEQSLRTRAEQIEREIAEQYSGDLKKYRDNERKKTEITIEQLEAQKAAKEREGVDASGEDAALLEAQRQLNQLNLDADLLAAGENARAKYEARKAYLDKERLLAEGNADAIAEIDAKGLANKQELMQAQIEAVEMWANASMQLMSGVNELFNALGEAKLQKEQEDYDRESEMLKEQLDKGYITQEEYDKKQETLDKNLEKEQKKIARQQAIREKAMAMFQILIDTSLGIMKAVASSPWTGGLPWSAIVGAIGAVQLAAVAAQPLPKAARGRKISGKSHAQGGELVVAEDGEIIMNKRSVSMFEPILSEMSVAGGGIPFSSHIPDGGYTARYAMSSGLSGEDIREAIKDLKVYTTIEDIRREDRKYTDIEARGTI